MQAKARAQQQGRSYLPSAIFRPGLRSLTARACLLALGAQGAGFALSNYLTTFLSQERGLSLSVAGIYVLFNLLKNAFYSLQSAQKGVIEITLSKGDDFNVLKFRDTGLGIDAAIINRIFDGFFTTKSDGTGAGLAFCKRTIQSFGGKIECVSEQGDFAEFIISLPVVPPGENARVTAYQPLSE